MNGAVFNRLSKLEQVELGQNFCISEEFKGKIRIASMQSIVSLRCGFCEFHPYIDELSAILDKIRDNESDRKTIALLNEIQKGQKHQIEILTTFINQTLVDNSRNLATLTKQAAELEVAKAEIENLRQTVKQEKESNLKLSREIEEWKSQAGIENNKLESCQN